MTSILALNKGFENNERFNNMYREFSIKKLNLSDEDFDRFAEVLLLGEASQRYIDEIGDKSEVACEILEEYIVLKDNGRVFSNLNVHSKAPSELIINIANIASLLTTRNDILVERKSLANNHFNYVDATKQPYDYSDIIEAMNFTSRLVQSCLFNTLYKLSERDETESKRFQNDHPCSYNNLLDELILIDSSIDKNDLYFKLRKIVITNDYNVRFIMREALAGYTLELILYSGKTKQVRVPASLFEVYKDVLKGKHKQEGLNVPGLEDAIKNCKADISIFTGVEEITLSELLMKNKDGVGKLIASAHRLK